MKSLTILLVAALCIATTSAAVFSIDFGGYWTKSAVVRPGKNPIQIVLNEQSKRKTPAAVSFPPVGERYFSELAANALTRYPSLTAKHLRRLIGKAYGSVDLSKFDQYYFPFAMKNDTERGTYRLDFAEGGEYSVEEVTAMILRQLHHMAEAHAEMQMKDCVITVPPYFGQRERQALLDAAELSGVNPLSLLNENTAVAFKYGIDRPLDEKTEKNGRTVAFVDMGSSSLTVTIVKYSLVEDKSAKGKDPKSVGSLQVVGVAWDETLGGYALDRIVAKRLADVFAEQHGSKPDYRPVFEVPRSLARLYKDAEKARLVLSANQEALVIIEGLVGDLDLKYKFTREEFENLAKDLLVRVRPVAERALIEANMTKDDIDYVEIVGGATRTPRVKEDITAIFEKEVSTSLNADEACALGAALYAASLSGAFRLRKFNVNDALPYSFDVDRATSEGMKSATIFKRYNKMPSRKALTVNETTGDMDMQLRHSNMDVVARMEDEMVQQFKILGVKEVIEKHTNVSSSSTKVYFTYGRDGIVQVDKAEAVIEQTLFVKEEVKKSNVTDKKDASANEKTEETSDDAAKTAENESKDESKEYELVEKKYTRRENLNIEIAYTSFVGLTRKQIIASEKLLRELDRRDANKKKADEVRNAIETYIYDTKDKLSEYQDDWEIISKVSTEEQREELFSALNAADDWLFEVDGAADNLSKFEEKLQELKKLGDPIFARKREFLKRPEAIGAANKLLSTMNQAIKAWNTSKPQITEDEKTDLMELINGTKEFIENKTREQDAKPLTEDPVFLAADIDAKMERVVKLYERLLRKPKPKAPKAPKKKKSDAESPKDSSTEEAAKEEPSDSDRESAKETDTSDNKTESQPEDKTESGSETGADDSQTAEEQ